MLTEDIKFEVLYDHYKDTFNQIQKHIRLRERLFAFILIIITLMLFQIFSPKESGEAISQFVVNRIGLNSPINTSFIGSVIWFILFSLTTRYFQTVVYIERQYNYIHKLEKRISLNYNKETFTREGKSYLNNYPLFSEWTWRLYTMIFPILLIIVVLIKIFSELSNISCNVSVSVLLFNIMISIFTIISTLFYLLLVHFKK